MGPERIVEPLEASGLSASLHPRGPKWTIRCGACPATFQARIPHVDDPSVRCPFCDTWNQLTGITWGAH